MTNDIFKNQSEFIMHDFGFTEETIYTRYSLFISPEKVKGLSILDIGCFHAAAGAYVLSNGAKEYIGVDFDINSVDIANKNLEKYYKNYSWNIVHSSIADYLKVNDKKFDIIFLSRTLHGMSYDSVETLVALSSICDSIVIESGSAVKPLLKIRKLLKEKKLSNDPGIDELLYFLEYEYPGMEFMKNTNGDFYNVRHSLGFLKTLFNRLGFVEDLSSYEKLKSMYPEEYGFGSDENIDETVIGKYIIKFDKASSGKPLSWEDFKNV
jgi:SAM-dependent methyltransferase